MVGVKSGCTAHSKLQTPRPSGEQAMKSPKAKSRIPNRSLVVAGRKTGVSLEDDFWGALKEIAKERGSTVGALVTGINADRRNPNLSSAIRLFVLDHCQEQFATLKGRKPSA